MIWIITTFILAVALFIAVVWIVVDRIFARGGFTIMFETEQEPDSKSK